MNLSEKIDAIVARRKLAIPKIEEAKKRLQGAAALIAKLEAFRDDMETDGAQEVGVSLGSLSTSEFRKNYQKALDDLNDLLKRFSRDEINISFVGRAGQGKSLILQKISGLGGDVIPSADGSDCTGARSIISNNTASGETNARITFFSEPELVTIVNRYLEGIEGPDHRRVFSAKDIANIDIAEIREKLSPEQEREQALLEHLAKYQCHIGEFQDQLGKTKTVSKPEIEQYVAQYKSSDKNTKYHKYLGVKEAIISSPFPFADAGKIVLVDTIGTGATSLGVEQEMLETARNNSDAVVVMKRPDPLRPRLEDVDYELLRMLRESLGADYSSKLLFWLFNRVESERGSNSESIESLIEKMKAKNLAVASYVNVDCSQEREVQEKLLIPLLEQMASHLPETDSLLVDKVNKNLARTASSFASVCKGLDKAISGSLDTDLRRAFKAPNREIIKNTTNSLRDLYLDLNNKKTSNCQVLEDIAREKLKRVTSCVPTREEIRALLDDGTLNKFNVIEICMDRIRLEIIDEFLKIDVVLDTVVKEAKQAIIRILSDDNLGRLARIARENTDNPDAWLERMIDRIDDPKFTQLRNAMQSLRSFRLSVENYLLYKVRASLNTIDWNLLETTPTLVNEMNDKDALAEEINLTLNERLETVRRNINAELKGYCTFPNEAVYAVTRDFCDRLTAKAARPEAFYNVNDEWEMLYEDNINAIWPEQALKFGKNAQYLGQWKDISDGLSQCDKEGYLLIN